MTTIRVTEYKDGAEFVSVRRIDTNDAREAMQSVVGCVAMANAGRANVDDNSKPVDAQVEVVGMTGYVRLEVLR